MSRGSVMITKKKFLEMLVGVADNTDLVFVHVKFKGASKGACSGEMCKIKSACINGNAIQICVDSEDWSKARKTEEK